ncbi:MAG: glycosyltransferase, partial [Balneolaceae bacterium]
SPGTFYLAARTLGIARRIEKIILQTARQHRFKQGLIYSYWMNQACMGGILAAKKLGWPVVSRAHGGDLYLERHPKSYLPWHEWKAGHLDYLFPVSENGRNYLVQRYPEYKDKILVQYLGVKGGEKRKNRAGGPDELHVASCSAIIPLKRVDRIFETVLALYDRLKMESSGSFKKIRWTHFGDGPGFDALKEKIHRTNKPGLQITLMGRVEPEFVTDFYVREQVDLFLNYSTSEGIPVSIMEAASCGIPAAAPMTGGIPEIVNQETGILFDFNDTPETVAGLINSALAEGRLAEKGENAYSLLSKKFSMEKNHRQFTDFLTRL